MAKVDSQGNLISNHEELKTLYVDTYKHRLRHRNMNANFHYLKELKENLFEERIKLSKMRKSPCWREDDLIKVLKSLKSKKSADPVGLINELFKPGVAGSDVISSLLLLSNKVKYECEIPDFVQLTNISSIYKRRGSKNDLNNDRGIFNVASVRSIIDKLVYGDIYDIVDGNMSDSNVGGRKRRNIRDNLFIINGVINYGIKEKINIDITLYDIMKCFDAMWYQETMNDMWDVGVQDDKFALMAKMNEKCSIAIKTPVGMTERFEATEIEMQGTVPGPIKACVQVDTLGRDSYLYNEALFLYKDCVFVPPLSMCDDVASIARCGIDSIKTNAIINSKIVSKKLELGPTKCFNIHVGGDTGSCCSLKVHDSLMKKSNHETYLGDVICNSGSNEKNITSKANKGVGAISQIFSMLSQVSLGHFYFETALVMRDSMLISKLVASSEVWYNITKTEYQKLENIDETFTRRLLNVQSSVPKESLYIEIGKLPVKFIIKTRRLMYWWHLTNLNKTELLYKFYTAQNLKTNHGDWVVQLDKDKKELNLQLTDDDIRTFSQDQFRKIVQEKIELLAGKFLIEQRNKHSKSENLKFEGFKPANYLMSRNLTTKEVQTLFSLRSRMIDVKANFPSTNQDNLWCKLCFLFPETQQHLLECPEVRIRTKHIIEFKALDYQMLFGNLKNQEKITKNFQIILEARNDLLNTRN